MSRFFLSVFRSAKMRILLSYRIADDLSAGVKSQHAGVQRHVPVLGIHQMLSGVTGVVSIPGRVLFFYFPGDHVDICGVQDLADPFSAVDTVCKEKDIEAVDPFLLQDLAGTSAKNDTRTLRGDLHDRITLVVEDRIFIIVRDRRNSSQERIAFCDMFFGSFDDLRVDPHGQGGFLDDVFVIKFNSEGLGNFFSDGVPAGTVNAADRDYFHVVFSCYYYRYDRKVQTFIVYTF